ncbi:lipid II:glycine glycyltransferase FemX [Streptomyces luteireticuli]|uniref:lipid II:glycine glycyltransferase FemX n=1 Tax=Streptomyces luteireticuli TaxID=173858 RepID=UPI0035567031
MSSSDSAGRPAGDCPLQLVPLGEQEYLAWIDTSLCKSRGGIGPRQCPSWGRSQNGWVSEVVGWKTPGGRLVGAALVLSRSLPRLRERFCYIPDGPNIAWTTPYPDRWLSPLVDHLATNGAFAIRMSPPLRRSLWQARTVQEATRSRTPRKLGDITPDAIDPIGSTVTDYLITQGWTLVIDDTSPHYTIQLPLVNRSIHSLWSNLDRQWKGSIEYAQEAGLESFQGGVIDLSGLRRLMLAAEEHHGLSPDLSFFSLRRLYHGMNAERAGRMRLFLAQYHGKILAAHFLAFIGDQAWYLHGATNSRRSLYPGHALQWQMICHSLTRGASAYHAQRVPGTLDIHAGDNSVLRRNLGLGGHVVEPLGHWQLILNQRLYRAFRLCRSGEYKKLLRADI